MISIPTYQTPRLTLRLFLPEILRQAFHQLDEQGVMAYLELYDQADYVKLATWHQHGIESWNNTSAYFQVKLKETGETIGACMLHHWAPDHRRAELGYFLHHQQFMGKGYATEAVDFVLNYGFNTLNLHRIEALVGPTNEASLAIVRRFGFLQEGHLKEHYYRDGVFEDSLVFGLLQSAYLRK